MFFIESLSEETRFLINSQVAASWGAPLIVSRGVLHDTRTQPGFIAVADGAFAGYALYNLEGIDCELTVLESLRNGLGIGGELVKEVLRVAKASGCRRVWLCTTNDNTHAIRFYQRFGFELRAVHINSMDEARLLKPQIPLTGDDDIPIKHEFEFELQLNTHE